MSAGNPSGPVVATGIPAEDAEAVAWDVAHLVANGTPVVVAAPAESEFAAALERIGVAVEPTAPAAVSDVDPGVVALVPADAAEPVANSLDATLVTLGEASGPEDADGVVADAGLKNPVISALEGAEASGTRAEVTP